MITINRDGDVSINFLDIMDNTSPEFKLNLIEVLACEDTIIKHVMDQVLHGYTENGYSGTVVVDNLRIGSELQKARDCVMKQGNKLLVVELKRLRRVLENRHKYQDEGWNQYHKLCEKQRTNY